MADFPSNSDGGSYVDGEGNQYVDSGATAHITNHINNLTISSDYSRGDGLMVGNGNVVPISSIGLNSLPISSAYSQSLMLNNILFVPQITKSF